MEHFLTDMSNRVEHQKLNQVAAELPPGWVFGVQLGLRQTQALIKIKTIRRGKVPLSTLLLGIKLLLFSNTAGGTFPLLIVFVLISVCVCRRLRWTPKTQPNGCSAVVLSFWYSNTSYLKTSVPTDAENRNKPCDGLQYLPIWVEVKFLHKWMPAFGISLVQTVLWIICTW